MKDPKQRDVTGEQAERLYRKGWKQKDQERLELYYNIINDFAEGLYVKERCNERVLIELIGHLTHEIQIANEAFNHFQSRLAVEVTKGLLDRMEELRK